MYAYSNNGLSLRAWNDPNTLAAGEVYFDHEPTAAELAAAFSGYAAAMAAQQETAASAPLLAQIATLEAQGHRASRAVTLALALGKTPSDDDLAKLQSIETQIVALRVQLK